MCVVSMVFDKFNPMFPPWYPESTAPPWQPDPVAPTPAPAIPSPFVTGPSLAEILELRKLIADFKEALAAAKVVDRLTGQPDCEDPEKAKLVERVEALERALAKLSKPKRRRKKGAATAKAPR